MDFLEVLEKTEGTPFFMEEVVQTLAEEGVLAGERGHYCLQAMPAELHLLQPNCFCSSTIVQSIGMSGDTRPTIPNCILPRLAKKNRASC